jgi:hypothetical protein
VCCCALRSVHTQPSSGSTDCRNAATGADGVPAVVGNTCCRTSCTSGFCINCRKDDACCASLSTVCTQYCSMHAGSACVHHPNGISTTPKKCCNRPRASQPYEEAYTNDCKPHVAVPTCGMLHRYPMCCTTCVTCGPVDWRTRTSASVRPSPCDSRASRKVTQPSTTPR